MARSMNLSSDMGGKKGTFLSLPVMAAISVMCSVYFTTVFVFLQDWLELNSFLGWTNAIIFSFIAFMCLLAFGESVLTDPGGVPSSFTPDMENPPKNDSSLYCDKCCAYKPPRTHHCRVCKRCVLKMDHHCVWIGNCVGYANYKSFIGCIFYGSIASIYSMVIFFCDALHKDHGFKSSAFKLFYQVLSGLALITLSIALSSLFAWHIYLLSQNLTTIEYREAARATWLARKCGQNYRHPFNLGVHSNLKSILGPNVLKWLWPRALGHLNGGTQFPISTH